MILPNYRKHVHAWSRCRSEHFDDFALGIHMARLPVVETYNNFVANSSAGAQPSILILLYRTDVNVVHEAWIIRDNVIKIPRPLERPNNGIVRAFQDSNDASFASAFY